MKYLFSICLLLCIACSPKINYLGDTLPATTEVDVFYDQGDIKNDYRVMGLISANNTNNSLLNLEDVKNKLIEESKMKGADAILFSNLFSDNTNDNHFIDAKLLKYN